MKTFELKNEHRIYFGLNPTEKKWEKVVYTKGFACYFEKDIIRKVVNYSDQPNYYIEFDTQIPTNKRNKIIPKTGKGKEKTISPTTVRAFNAKTTHLEIFIEEEKKKKISINWTIGKQKLDIENNTSCFKSSQSLEDLEENINKFIKTLPKNHLQIIEELKFKKEEKTKPVRFKSGDFFAVPVKFDLYGNITEYTFGRHLLNIADLRKRGIVNKNHHWHYLMTVVQLVSLYDYNSASLKQDLQQLKTKKTVPSFYMMDDNLMRGKYPVIGNIPLQVEELTFPLHYGSYLDYKKKGFYFGWGICMLDNVKEFSVNGKSHYANNGVIAGASMRYLEMLRKGKPPYDEFWDISHPNNQELKNKIFKSLGVSPDIDYDSFCKKFGFKTRKELLELG